MNWHLAFVAVDVATIVCAALFGARVLFCFSRERSAYLIGLLCVAVICHVLLARYDYRAWIPAPYQIDFGIWGHLVNLLRNTAPGLFMILVHRLFTDELRFPPWLLALFALQLFLEEPARWLLPGAPFAWWATAFAPTLLQTLFGAAALYWTIADWRADLVETRRRTRALILIVLTIDVVASSVLLRVVIPSGSSANYRAHLLLSVVNLAILMFLLFRAMGADLAAYLGATKPASIPATAMSKGDDPDTARALDTLNNLLDREHVYRRPGLTLDALAMRVGIPEYRLRRLIHERLGYRNFNAFLHAYRIREACAQLSNPDLRRTPILTIALSVGYQSINTFNRGFREVMGVTPSAYRTAEPSALSKNPSPKTA